MIQNLKDEIIHGRTCTFKKYSNVISLEKSDFKLVEQLNKKSKRDVGCSGIHLKKSFDKHINAGLKYNKQTGVMSDKTGWLEKFSYKKDIPKNPTRGDVIEWQFIRHIANSCSRMRRGYKP